MDKYQETMQSAFREEAYELLSELEDSLLELETTPDDQELIDKVFRAMHTIKGSGAMFGFENIAHFTHELETVFDMARNGKLAVTKNLIDLTLKARDHIRSLLDTPDAEHISGKGDDIIALLHNLSGGDVTEPASESTAEKQHEKIEKIEEKLACFRIRFRPCSEIFLHGTNPLMLLNELRELGECIIVGNTGDIPELKKINAEHNYISWDIILSTDKGLNSIQDVFIFVEDDSDLSIEVIDESEDIGTAAGVKKLGEILLERGDIDREKLQKILGGKQLIGDMLVDAGLVSSEKVESALAEQQQIKSVREKRRKEEAASSIRVNSDKLDTLIDLVGELVIVQARLSQTSDQNHENSELLSISEDVEHLISELRDNAMSLRMVPIGTTFSRFKRLVRDLSGQLGKSIELTTEGAETELDKTVIERLNDPLVHLIRNCIDHGIEMPDQRVKAGKPETGIIHLSSSYSGANVMIRIKDDGAGLDANSIHAKAVEKGLIQADANLSERDIYQLIFAPGFSTAKEVTDVSGRGVGMDVAKRTIDNLSGSIDINSSPGTGTVISLKIPLTLAIIEGLLVRIEKNNYVIPLSAIEECVELSRADIEKANDRNLMNIRGNLLPYVNLRQFFRLPGTPPEIEQVVITSSEGNKVGFTVDNVIGQFQTVIKSLGKLYSDVEGVTGATILGDGTVALILDIQKLKEVAEAEERKAVR